MKMWIARAESGDLKFYQTKPQHEVSMLTGGVYWTDVCICFRYIDNYISNLISDALGVKFIISGDTTKVVSYKLELDKRYDVVTLKEGQYIAGYLVKKDNKKIAWIKISSSESNLIDHVSICAELKFKKMIFIGAAGALKPEFEIGDICTPSFSIAGDNAHTFLKESIDDYIPYEKVEPDMKFIDDVIARESKKNITIKKASVFCTPSIALEYIHLNEIKNFNTDLIEMETAGFYLMADLIEVPSIALLVVSDNSSTGVALIGRTKEEQNNYNHGRYDLLPTLIFDIVNMK